MQPKNNAEKEITSKSLDCVISVDVGEKESGVAIIMLNGESLSDRQINGLVANNGSIVDKITKYYVKYKCLVVIEDILPYGRKVSKNVINTIKFIGELQYRLKFEVGVEYRLITRTEVRKWIFGRFYDLCVPKINKKIEYLDQYGEKKNAELESSGKKPKYRRYRNKDGEIRKSSFHYVDDRIVQQSMMEYWKIEKGKPFQRNKSGFSTHSWQALALGTYFLNSSYFG